MLPARARVSLLLPDVPELPKAHAFVTVYEAARTGSYYVCCVAVHQHPLF